MRLGGARAGMPGTIGRRPLGSRGAATLKEQAGRPSFPIALPDDLPLSVGSVVGSRASAASALHLPQNLLCAPGPPPWKGLLALTPPQR